MKRLTLVVALAATTLGVAACGSSNDPVPTGNSTDRAFVSEMIPHHASAVAMARIAQTRGTSPFVKQLAADIVRTQSAEISIMRARDAALAKQGVDVGKLGIPTDAMGMNMSTGSLKSASPFDPAFLRMMLPHHMGAITMARVELARGGDSRLKRLASAIIAAQQREIGQMRAAL